MSGSGFCGGWVLSVSNSATNSVFRTRKAFYTAPCDELLVWVLPTDVVPDLQAWQGMTRDAFESGAMRALANQPTVALFGLSDGVAREIDFARPCAMRTMVVLLLRAAGRGQNVDMQCVIPRGDVWPFFEKHE